MHLAQRFTAIVLSLGLGAGVVGLTGCGFHLKGTQPSQAVAYQKLQLQFPENVNSSIDTDDLQSRLSVYLGAAGVQLSQASDAQVLKITDYTPRRQLLNGKLTEVLLRLSVTFHIEDQNGNLITVPRTLTATRSYQFDLATVNTENQEESFLNGIMVDDLAQQISRQIASNRLPKVDPRDFKQSSTKPSSAKPDAAP